MVEQYIYKNRNGAKRKVGYMAACDCGDNGEVHIGFGLCSASDKFSKELAYAIADGRMNRGEIKIPDSIVTDIALFVERCRRYYKGRTLPTITTKGNDFYLVNF